MTALGRGARLVGLVAVVCTVAACASMRGSAPPPPGRLVDAGEARAHIDCRGTGRDGGPIIVLEAGGGAWSLAWGHVQADLARTYRVCAYDRWGYGWSAPTDGQRDGRRIAAHLERVLEAAGEHPPFVLAGHSLGGAYALLFAASHPTSVRGLVLVDSVHPDQLTRLSGNRRLGLAIVRGVLVPLEWMARAGILAYRAPNAAPHDVPPFDTTPPPIVSWQHMQAFRWELGAMPATLSEMNEVPALSVPLVVVMAGRNPERGWRELQQELLRFSSRSQFAVIEEADHRSILLLQPNAARIAARIREVVESP